MFKNGSSEWKPIKEKRKVDAIGEPTTIEVQGLKRKDGFRITHELWENLGHGRPDIFLCKGDFGEFRFAASRLEARTPTRTYQVFLNVSISDPEMCKTYSTDIESALLHFPPVRAEYKQVPLEEVLFNENGSLVRANDLNTSNPGHPHTP